MNASNKEIATSIKRSERRKISVIKIIPVSDHKIIFDALPVVAIIVGCFFKSII